MQATENRRLRVCVVGPGTRFLSGISYYSLHLANALARAYDVSAILMRQLLPTALYPGRRRVGAALSGLKFTPEVKVFDGIDWYWLPSLVRAIAFLWRERPDFLVLQWWSGTVLHSYFVLALAARVLGARVLVEFHEVLDPGEARLILARTYVNLIARVLLRLASGFVAHSEFDRSLLGKRYEIKGAAVAVIPHGPYDQYRMTNAEKTHRDAPKSCCNILFFGVIRPFKGLEDLIAAFESIPQNEIERYWLTVVGEAWEGWTLPVQLIEQSPYRDRITFVNRYVRDDELAAFLAGADAVVLPYHRSSSSGPLHVAMSCGLPVVVTRVGGLPEAVSEYEGAFLAPPRDRDALREALVRVAAMRGQRFADPHSWERTVERYQQLLGVIGAAAPISHRPPPREQLDAAPERADANPASR